MSYDKTEKNSYSGWLLLSILLLGVGLFSVYSATNLTHIPDKLYIQLTTEHKQPIDKTADSSYYFTLYSGIGFSIAGAITLIFTIILYSKQTYPSYASQK